MPLKKVVKQFNDFKSQHPLLAKEWNYKRNRNINPSQVLSHSNKKVWWKCRKCGYEWQAKINNRVNGSGCPMCARIKRGLATQKRNLVIGKTDLATVNPRIAEEWNYAKNGNLEPRDFTAFSNKVVWWKCSKGHEWKSSIAHRTLGSNCPYCRKQSRLRRTIIGE